MGVKSQVKEAQMECFLDAHVPSSQTNRHDSLSPCSGSSSPHTTGSAPLTSPAEPNSYHLHLLHLQGCQGEGPSGASASPVSPFLQYSACMLRTCRQQGGAGGTRPPGTLLLMPVSLGSHSLFLFPAGNFTPVEPGLGHRCDSTVTWILIGSSLHL